MKTKGIKVLMVLGFLISSTIFTSMGQVSKLEGVSLKINAGALSYFGDLSSNNLNLPKRIAEGSKFGISASVIKQFKPYFGIQGQFLAGNLYTSASDNTYFTGSLTEFGLSARFDPLKLLKKKTFLLSPYVSFGLATFSFRSVRRENETNLVLLPNFGYNNDGLTKANKHTAMSMPMAIGLSCQIRRNLQIELEHALRITNTDLLDCFKGPGTGNDLYSLTSIGFRYTIPTRSTVKIEKPIIVISPPVEVKAVIPVINVFIECKLPETIQAGQTFDVNLRINKGNYQDHAKLIQKYPEGFTAINNLAKSNSFSFSGQTVIIEWEKMPADSIVTYDYQVKVGDNLAGSQTIVGRFEYQHEGIQTVRFNKSLFIAVRKLTVEKEVTISQVQKQPDSVIISKAAPVTKEIIKPAQTSTGIEYRIQYGASKNKNQASLGLAAKYGLKEVIQEEYLDGWYKYTIGSFRTLKEAASYRNSFAARTNLSAAFVVAYKDGRRLAKVSDAAK